MGSVKLSALRVYELSTVIDSISPKDLITIKDIRLTSNLVKDLQTACKDYSDKMNDLGVKQQTLLKKYQESIKDKIEELPEEEKQALINETNNKFQAEVTKKYGKELDETNKTGLGEITVELSDEKMERLKDLFDKYAAQMYVKKDILLEVAEALGL